MRKFVIERNIPGAGKLSPSELRAMAQKSCAVLQELGPTPEPDPIEQTNAKQPASKARK